MHPNPFNNPRYSDAAWIRPCRSARSGLALMASHDDQRDQLHHDIDAWLIEGHCIESLPEGTCQGLSKYDPENMSLFGAIHEWEHGQI